MAPAVSPEARHPRAEVLVATTWRCNLRCSYCFVQECDLARGGARMSPLLAVRVLDALDRGLADVESVCVHLYGGEPLTNLPALRAMVERAAEKPPGRFTFAVTTNGTCASDEAIELLGCGRFQVILSIDGPAPVHDECRKTVAGDSTHAQVLAFLGKLRARTDCRVRGSAVVRSGWSLARAEAYLRTLPVDAVKAQAVRGPEGTPYALSAEEKGAYLRDLDELGRQVVAELEADRVPLDDRFSNRVLQLLAGFERESFCGAGETTFGVTPTGEVLPCVLMEADGHRLGHVDADPASWREAGARWRQRRQAPRPECRGCAALPLCGGGCPALLPVCGADECDYVRKCCQVAAGIYEHFRSRPEKLLTLAGIH